jgi:hypothetical protein
MTYLNCFWLYLESPLKAAASNLGHKRPPVQGCGFHSLLSHHSFDGPSPQLYGPQSAPLHMTPSLPETLAWDWAASSQLSFKLVLASASELQAGLLVLHGLPQHPAFFPVVHLSCSIKEQYRSSPCRLGPGLVASYANMDLAQSISAR